MLRGVSYSRVMNYMFDNNFEEVDVFIKNMQKNMTDDKIENIVKNVRCYIDDDYSYFLEDYIKIRRDNLVLEYEKHTSELIENKEKIAQHNFFPNVNLINYDKTTTEIIIIINKKIEDEKEKIYNNEDENCI